MSVAISASHPGIIPYLVKEGLVPDESINIQIEFPTDGAVTITYQVFMTGDRLARFQRAFAEYLKSAGGTDRVMI